MTKISVCIPTYEMWGRGAEFLSHSLKLIFEQTHSNYEVIVSDNSMDNKIQEAASRFNVKYVRNLGANNCAANLNNAIRFSSGDLIKIVLQDDFLCRKDALKQIATGVEGKDWLVHSYFHGDEDGLHWNRPTKPHLNEPGSLHSRNTFGSPTCLAFRKTDLFFDESLVWLVDCEFYARMFRRFGPPVLLAEPMAVVRLWPGQITNTLATREVRRNEAIYVAAKHGTAAPRYAESGQSQ